MAFNTGNARLVKDELSSLVKLRIELPLKSLHVEHFGRWTSMELPRASDSTVRVRFLLAAYNIRPLAGALGRIPALNLQTYELYSPSEAIADKKQNWKLAELVRDADVGYGREKNFMVIYRSGLYVLVPEAEVSDWPISHCLVGGRKEKKSDGQYSTISWSHLAKGTKVGLDYCVDDAAKWQHYVNGGHDEEFDLELIRYSSWTLVKALQPVILVVHRTRIVRDDYAKLLLVACSVQILSVHSDAKHRVAEMKASPPTTLEDDAEQQLPKDDDGLLYQAVHLVDTSTSLVVRMVRRAGQIIGTLAVRRTQPPIETAENNALEHPPVWIVGISGLRRPYQEDEDFGDMSE